MNLNHMQYFVTTGRLGSIARAAEALNVSRSAISDAIRLLEDEINAPLFHRVGRNLVLTEIGTVCLARSEQVLKDVFLLKQEMLSYNGQKHTLKMGSAAVTGTVVFPYLFSCKSHFMDTIELNIDCDDVEQLLNQVSTEKLDFCFVEGPHYVDISLPETADHQNVLIQAVYPELSSRKILSSQIVLCVSENHPLCDRTCVGFSELLDQPLILFKDGYQSKMVLDEFQRHGKKPHIVFTSNQVYTVSTLVRANFGIAFMDACIASNLSGVHIVPLEEDFSYDIWVAWKERSHAGHVNRFIRFLTMLNYTCDHSTLHNLLPQNQAN